MALALLLILFHSKSGIAIATMFRDLWGRGWGVNHVFQRNWHTLYSDVNLDANIESLYKHNVKYIEKT